MTGGRFKITPRAGGELVPPLEVLDAVESGGVPMGHTASYYYVGKTPVSARPPLWGSGPRCRSA